MDKHTTIVIIASIVIAIPFVYSGWNIYALDHLQLRGIDDGNFRFFDMINGGHVEICNSMPFFVNFHKFSIFTFFNDADKGAYSITGHTLAPLSSKIVNGTFSSETFSEAQYLALHFDGMFYGSAPERIDPRQLKIITQIEVPIIGIIPYTITSQYSALYFWDTLNGKIGEYNC
ncbi:MAG TPA: thr operon leader peptide [Nitrosopumilaceae archaeon]|nr:thr operon leader peptide [Nitrosopumilaceae archaeon]